MTVKNIFDTREKNGLVGIYVGEGSGEEVFLLSGGEYKRLFFSPAVGMIIGEEEYEILSRAAERTRAISCCAKLLSAGEKSISQLVGKMRQKGISKESAEHAVELLKRKGYINEEESAARIAESAVKSKHYGKRRISAYLFSHGYSSQISDRAAESIPDEDYRAALRYNMRKKYPDFSTLSADEKKKAVLALIRLGFSYDEIKTAAESAEEI